MLIKILYIYPVLTFKSPYPNVGSIEAKLTRLFPPHTLDQSAISKRTMSPLLNKEPTPPHSTPPPPFRLFRVHSNETDFFRF